MINVFGSPFKASSYDVDGISSKGLADIFKLSVENILFGYWGLQVLLIT
jgi:hypothetical protein